MFISPKLAQKVRVLVEKVFSEVIHLTFQNIDFSSTSPADILGKLEPLLFSLSIKVFSEIFSITTLSKFECVYGVR